MSGYRFPAPLETPLVSKLCKENPTLQAQLHAKTCVQKNPDAFSVLLHAALSSSMALTAVARNIGKSQMQTHTHAEKYAVLWLQDWWTLGLLLRVKNCFQAGIKWNKNIVSSQASSDLVQLDIVNTFGTSLGMFNKTYRVCTLRFSVRRCKMEFELTCKWQLNRQLHTEFILTDLHVPTSFLQQSNKLTFLASVARKDWDAGGDQIKCWASMWTFTAPVILLILSHLVLYLLQTHSERDVTLQPSPFTECLKCMEAYVDLLSGTPKSHGLFNKGIYRKWKDLIQRLQSVCLQNSN